ncbi:MAG TPA: 4-(cytidine 5'-diphospho)-2-C-methyl-D-erythritol kinase [Candidatus Angelobacter sp.]|jgi:4-diphosphocytidyl-2-C-methyl-D-erythritol kinase|nr:4-(cytidine 5'-diphospho)-2-C-methyl-D-erythritol kinase [Candidatus Angelobacter sp.]
MAIAARSFAKINIGLRIGPRREDGFHELRTIYQTLAIHDVVRVDVGRGVGINVYCKNPQVPSDETNTCCRVAERVLHTLKTRGKVRITIEKNLPVQGGLGGASSNAVVTILALERALKLQLTPTDRLRIASEVGSDLPLFLTGGTMLGIGRGEQVYPLEDLPSIPCVVATPPIGVSTPLAFAEWDKKLKEQKLTSLEHSITMNEFSHSIYEWLGRSNGSSTGVPEKSWDRAETLLLDLVRAGIENDFETVVFSLHPAIREVKRVLERSGARYSSLSGSGSTVYGLFDDAETAATAAAGLNEKGIPAQATCTLTRVEYWKEMFRK